MMKSKSQEKLIGGNIIAHINQRKKQMEELEASSQNMLQEAMQRALSGGRPNSLGKFMKKLENNDFQITPQKAQNIELKVADFSNSYIANARNKTPTNTRIGNLTLLNQKPKAHIEPSAPQIMKQSTEKPMINLNIAEKGKPEMNHAEDNFSMETKSQCTQYTHTDNHLTDRAANKAARNNVTERNNETFDAQMAQRFMIKKQRTTVHQNSKESSQQSQMSERNFEINSNDNQNEEQPLTSNKIIEFQMDDEAVNIQDQEPNIDLVRQFNLENKRSNTASANASIQIFNQEKQQEMVDFERESNQPSLNYAGDVLNIISHPSQYAHSEVGDGAVQRQEKEAPKQDEISEEESPEPRQNFPLQRTSSVIANPNHFVQPRSKSGQMLSGPKHPMTQNRAAYKPADSRVRLSTQAFGLLGKGASSNSQLEKATPTKSSRNLDNKLSSSQQKQPWGLSVNCPKRSNIVPSPRESAKSKSPIGVGQNSVTKNYAKSTYSRQGLKETVINQITELTEDKIKQDMVDAFTKIRLDLYSDVLRIKKPQNQAFLAGQMLCKLVNSFRGGSQKSNNDLLFQEWKQIQDFIHKKPNVIKFNQEITQLIQHMILSQDYLRQLKSNQLKNHLSKLSKIQQQYFGNETHEQVLQHFATNRNFQTIVNICFTVIRYVLYQAGRTELINLKNTRAINHGGRGSTKDDVCSAYNQTQTNQFQSNFSGKKSYSSYVNTRSTISVNKLNIGNSRQNSALKHGNQHSSRNTDALSSNKNGSGEGFNSTNRSVINTLKTPRQNLVRNSIKSPLPRQLNMRSASREKLFTPSSRNYSGQKQNVNQDSQSRSRTLYEIMLQKQKQSSQDKLERLTFNSHSKRQARASIHKSSAQKSVGGDSARLVQAESRQLFKTPIRDLITDNGNKQESPLLQMSGIKSGKKSLCSGQKRQLQGLKKINNATMSQNFNKGVEAESNSNHLNRSAEACKTRKRRKDRGQRKSVCSTKPRLDILKQDELADEAPANQKTITQEEESMGYDVDGAAPFQKAASTLLPVQMNSRPHVVANRDLGSLEITAHQSDLGSPLDISGLPNTDAGRIATEGDQIITESSQRNHMTSQSDDQVNLTTESDNAIEQQMQVCAPQPVSRPSRVASHVTSQGVAYEISTTLQQFDSANAYISMPRVEQPAPLPQVQVLDQEDVHVDVPKEQIKTIEPTEVEMLEEETTKKNFEKTQELLVGSPSVHTHTYTHNASSHQTSISSFNPDSYREDAFNIAALLKADCVGHSDAPSSVIEVKPSEQSMLYEQRQSLVSDAQDLSQLSQRTNQKDASTIFHQNEGHTDHFISESCPQTEKKSDYSSLYHQDKVTVPFDNQDSRFDQSMMTVDQGIEQTVKKGKFNQGIVEESTPTAPFKQASYEQEETFNSNHDSSKMNQTFEEPRESHRRETSLSQVEKIPHQVTAINTHNNSQQSATEDEEVLMQEIISPFRKTLFSGTQSSIGVKESSSFNRTFLNNESNDGSGWQINPIQVKKVDFAGDEAKTYDAELDNPGRDYSASECSSPTGSICESPVKGGSTQVHQISPGKLKQHLSNGTQEVLDQIDNIVNEIIQNSPSKHHNSTVNHDMIAKLKAKRIQQKSQQRTASQQSKVE